MTTPSPASPLSRDDWRARREITTPEGVPLTVELAEFSERAIALVIDLTIWLLASVAVLAILALLTHYGMSAGILLAVLMMLTFFFRNLYFIHFELSRHGATPGKRLVGIRVTDRRGGPLRPAAVIARNLTREIELFIPASILLSAPTGRSGFQWGYLLVLGWLICFMALMFMNRERMRAGDLIAGTMVIAVPRRRLLSDLVESRARFAFADHQLRAYGTRELQVLEDLLRRVDVGETPELLKDVCARICRKIEWTAPVPTEDTVSFLRDFYTAQRAFLEREKLFGRPRADKFEAAKRE